MGQPQIDTRHRFRLRECALRGLHDEAGEVPARGIPDHGHAGRIGRKRPGPAHTQVPDLRQPQPPVSQDPEPGVGGEPDRLPVIFAGLEPGRRDLRAFPLPGDRREEVPVRGVQVREGLLERHRGHLAEPGPLRGGLCRGQPGRQVRVGGVRQPGGVRLLAGAQPVVEHHRAQPNALASAICCTGVGYRR